MLSLSTVHIISIVLTLALVTALGIYSMKKVQNASDFAVGGRNIGAPLVAGTIVGTLVGGASTIGTSQLAFSYGFSAWWFTLGGGIACIFLGVFLASPLRKSGASTVPGFLADFYGKEARPLASIFSSLGIFLNIIAQILAAVALLTTILNLDPFISACIAIFLVISYVIFGGVWGAGLVGLLKTFLICFSLFIAGILAYNLGGGLSGFREIYPPYPWFSLFGRGYAVDLAAAFSLLVGVLSTQTYLQAVFSGKNTKSSQQGAIISGLIMPFIGIAAIWVGLYMRANHPEISPGEALPLFLVEYLPHSIGGVALATLLISIIGTGAGLVLGICTMLGQDIYKGIINPQASDEKVLFFTRISIILVTAITLVFVTGNLNSLILQWSFLSMGLRGATICFPLLGAILLKGFIKPKVGVIAIGLAPILTILWALFGPKSIDPLYIGLLASLSTLLLGSLIVEK